MDFEMAQMTITGYIFSFIVVTDPLPGPALLMVNEPPCASTMVLQL